MYQILATEGKAKRARLETVHGTIQTPVFMNVGTAAAIKGAVATTDLQEIGTQVELSNTYHLHVRPGDKVVKQLGGLHKFMNWDKPILTDSGGFQVFSLAGLRKIKEEGVYFHSHVDGRKIFMGPEEKMCIRDRKYVSAASVSVEGFAAASQHNSNLYEANERVVQSYNDRMQEFVQYQKLTAQTMEQVQNLLYNIVTSPDETHRTNIRNMAINNSNRDMLIQIQKTLEEQGSRQEELLETMVQYMKESTRSGKKGKGIFFN